MKLSEIVVSQVAEELTSDGPVELKDLFEPGRKEKFGAAYVKKLWGNPRLQFQGRSILGGDDNLYEDINGIIDGILSGMDPIEGYVPVEGTDELDMDGYEYEFTVEKGDFQECYLGYDPKDNSLYVGIDAWVSEDQFNAGWDDAFRRATGERFDIEDDEHANVYNSAFKEYQKQGFVGVLIHLTGDPIDGGYIIEHKPGGFYRGIKHTSAFAQYGLIDLRLD